MRKVIGLLLIASFIILPNCFAQYNELIGKEVQLKTLEGKIPVYAADTERGFNGITGNLMGNEPKNYLAKILGRVAFEVENNTKAKILEIDFWARAVKVEILDGGYAGYAGWVLINHAVGD